MLRVTQFILRPVPVAIAITAVAAALAVVVPYERCAWLALGLLAGYALSGST
jgi:hypothetical protein